MRISFFLVQKTDCAYNSVNQTFMSMNLPNEKTEDMYMIESRFYTLALEDPLKVIYEQMRWIGKEPDELQVLDSAYHKMREQEFVDFLASVKDYDVDDMKQFKKELVKEFRKEFFPDVSANNGTISNEKLECICARYGLILESQDDTEKRRKIYFIKDMEQEEGEGARC